MSTEIPKTIYKFRDWSNDYHKKALTHTEVYFSSSFDFNDPFDLNLPLKFKGTPNIDEKAVKFFYSPEGRESRRHGELEIGDSLKAIETKLGVFCASGNSKSILMWGHYSNSGKGFCIGYNSKRMKECLKDKLIPNGDFLKVSYLREFPEFDLNNINPRQNNKGIFIPHSLKRTTTKCKDWEYENEFRLLSNSLLNNSFCLSLDSIQEVIFGIKMNEKYKLEILEILNSKYPQIDIYQAFTSKNKFEISKRKIN